jgi:hypothetical protein
MKRNRQKSVFQKVLVTKWLLAVAGAGLVLAQNPGAGVEPGGHDPVAGSPSPQPQPMTVKQKLRYDARHFFDVDNIIFAGMGAGLDQLRDRPGEWGQGWGPYFERYGSHLGQYFIQRSIMFSVQAVDHEDARYYRSHRGSFGGRLGDAFLHTVWRHNDSGGMMPAYSEFFGDYGAAAVSRLWWPQRYHNASAVFVAGSDTVVIDAGINVLREFAPDVKRWLHLSRLPASVTDHTPLGP